MATWESNGHVTDDVTVTLKGQGRDPSIFGAHFLENGWRWGCDLVTVERL